MNEHLECPCGGLCLPWHLCHMGIPPTSQESIIALHSCLVLQPCAKISSGESTKSLKAALCSLTVVLELFIPAVSFPSQGKHFAFLHWVITSLQPQSFETVSYPILFAGCHSKKCCDIIHHFWKLSTICRHAVICLLCPVAVTPMKHGRWMSFSCSGSA